MLLSYILKNVNLLSGDFEDREIKKIEFDSRAVGRGDLFVATKGTATDGHDYIRSAVEKGAVAVVCETAPEETFNSGVPIIRVADSAEALGLMACNFYGNPSEKLTLIGVTGTNGKTTVATLLYRMFRELGYKAGLLSTVSNYVDGKAVPSTHTTPDALHLNELLADMVEVGCELAFMEVSSHSVAQKRICGLRFAGGIFTNLTRDHLDYHKTFESYLKAKKGFFDSLPKSAFAVTNRDDKNGMVVLQNTAAAKYTYSVKGMADFKTKILEDSFEGMLLEVDDVEVLMPFVGRFNAYNVTAVYAAAVLLGVDRREALRVLSGLKAVAGRFETLYAPTGYTAIVDYAHTPDALNNVLSTINEIRGGLGSLITVVGCGGNRDKGKRPIMAQEAVSASDRVILTSDNPRDEDPQSILNDMLEGIEITDRKKTLVIVDRREAIRTACALAVKGDVILVAGKGHEDYQIINGVKYHFDDKEEIRGNF
jgi:UDP-N-acetylmuramoyl-L-alanyl-D-glutamate--2,6-diaminopimelate ligase